MFVVFVLFNGTGNWIYYPSIKFCGPEYYVLVSMIRSQPNTFIDTCVIKNIFWKKAVHCHIVHCPLIQLRWAPCLRGNVERTPYFLEQSCNLGFSPAGLQNNQICQVSAVKTHYRHLWTRDQYSGVSSEMEYELRYDSQRSWWDIFDKEHSERRAKGKGDLLISPKIYWLPLTMHLLLEAQCLKFLELRLSEWSLILLNI